MLALGLFLFYGFCVFSCVLFLSVSLSFWRINVFIKYRNCDGRRRRCIERYSLQRTMSPSLSLCVYRLSLTSLYSRLSLNKKTHDSSHAHYKPEFINISTVVPIHVVRPGTCVKFGHVSRFVHRAVHEHNNKRTIMWTTNVCTNNLSTVTTVTPPTAYR